MGLDWDETTQIVTGSDEVWAHVVAICYLMHFMFDVNCEWIAILVITKGKGGVHLFVKTVNKIDIYIYIYISINFCEVMSFSNIYSLLHYNIYTRRFNQ